MSQSYKLRFDQMKESNPTQSNQESSAGEAIYYQNAGSTRNLCLRLVSGKSFFFNYAYLISAEFDPDNIKNVITIHFSNDTVKIYGFMLETLYMELFDHLPRIIRVTDARYALKEECTVTEIIIEKKTE